MKYISITQKMHTGGELVVSKEWLARCMRTYYTDVYNYGTRFTRNEQLVKHCIQEVFMGLWQSRHMTGEIKDMKCYLLREIKNQILTEAMWALMLKFLSLLP